MTALMLAGVLGNVEDVQLLLNNRANPNIVEAVTLHIFQNLEHVLLCTFIAFRYRSDLIYEEKSSWCCSVPLGK